MTDKTTNAEMKACPFCGGNKLVLCETKYGELQRSVWTVSCRTIDCAGAIWALGCGQFDTEDKAIRAWNTRAIEDAEAVAWQWRTKRGANEWTYGWAVSNLMPTRENCHLKEGDEIEVRPLYTHPPRATSAEDAIPVDYRAACCGRKECGGECGNEWRGNEPYIPESALCALLPGPYYMDPPDGGDVSVYEQLRRMARDAARWRKFLSMVDPDKVPGGFTVYFAVEKGTDQLCYFDCVTELVDAAMAQRGDKKDDDAM